MRPCFQTKRNKFLHKCARVCTYQPVELRALDPSKLQSQVACVSWGFWTLDLWKNTILLGTFYIKSNPTARWLQPWMMPLLYSALPTLTCTLPRPGQAVEWFLEPSMYPLVSCQVFIDTLDSAFLSYAGLEPLSYLWDISLLRLSFYALSSTLQIQGPTTHSRDKN